MCSFQVVSPPVCRSSRRVAPLRTRSTSCYSVWKEFAQQAENKNVRVTASRTQFGVECSETASLRSHLVKRAIVCVVSESSVKELHHVLRWTLDETIRLHELFSLCDRSTIHFKR